MAIKGRRRRGIVGLAALLVVAVVATALLWRSRGDGDELVTGPSGEAFYETTAEQLAAATSATWEPYGVNRFGRPSSVLIQRW